MSAKTSGLGDNFYIGGYDLSGDIASLERIGGGPAPGDVTGIKALARERIGLARDGGMQFTSHFNASSGQEHPVLSAMPVTDTAACYLRGTTLLNPAAGCIGKQVGYDPTRDNAGNLTVKTQVMANGYGLEWGVELTAGLRTDTTGTTGAFVDDNGAGTSLGAQAYLQVLSVVGTSCTVKVRHCTTSGGTYADLISFTAVNAGSVSSQRGAATGTVNRYLEVVTSGTFTSAVFAVVWVRNQVATVF